MLYDETESWSEKFQMSQKLDKIKEPMPDSGQMVGCFIIQIMMSLDPRKRKKQEEVRRRWIWICRIIIIVRVYTYTYVYIYKV